MKVDGRRPFSVIKRLDTIDTTLPVDNHHRGHTLRVRRNIVYTDGIGPLLVREEHTPKRWSINNKFTITSKSLLFPFYGRREMTLLLLRLKVV